MSSISAKALTNRPMESRMSFGIVYGFKSDPILLYWFAMADAPQDTYSEAETEVRREAALKRMLATPHKPHKRRGESKPQKVG